MNTERICPLRSTAVALPGQPKDKKAIVLAPNEIQITFHAIDVPCVGEKCALWIKCNECCAFALGAVVASNLDEAFEVFNDRDHPIRQQLCDLTNTLRDIREDNQRNTEEAPKRTLDAMQASFNMFTAYQAEQSRAAFEKGQAVLAQIAEAMKPPAAVPTEPNAEESSNSL